MKNLLKYALLLTLVFAFVSCEEDLITYDADGGQTGLSFARSSITVSVCEPTVDLVVESTTRSNSDRTYNVMVSSTSTAVAGEYSAASSVTIPAGEFVGSTPVTIDFAQVPDGAARSLVFELVAPEGEVISARGTSTFNFESACTLNEVIVDLSFDQYPEEAAYIIFDSTGAIVDASYNASGNIAFGTFAGQTSFTKTLCLPDGDYSVTFFDSYGDGNTGNANGAYGIIGVSCDSGNFNLFNPVVDGNFGANGSFLGTPPISVSFTLGN